MFTLSIAFFAALIIGSAIAYRLLRKPSHEPFTGEHVGWEWVVVNEPYAQTASTIFARRTPAEHAAGMQ